MVDRFTLTVLNVVFLRADGGFSACGTDTLSEGRSEELKGVTAFLGNVSGRGVTHFDADLVVWFILSRTGVLIIFSLVFTLNGVGFVGVKLKSCFVRVISYLRLSCRDPLLIMEDVFAVLSTDFSSGIITLYRGVESILSTNLRVVRLVLIRRRIAILCNIVVTPRKVRRNSTVKSTSNNLAVRRFKSRSHFILAYIRSGARMLQLINKDVLTIVFILGSRVFCYNCHALIGLIPSSFWDVVFCFIIITTRKVGIISHV